MGSKNVASPSIERIKDGLKPANLQDALAPPPNRDIYSSSNVAPHSHLKISSPANTPQSVYPISLVTPNIPMSYRAWCFDDLGTMPDTSCELERPGGLEGAL